MRQLYISFVCVSLSLLSFAQTNIPVKSMVGEIQSSSGTGPYTVLLNVSDLTGLSNGNDIQANGSWVFWRNAGGNCTRYVVASIVSQFPGEVTVVLDDPDGGGNPGFGFGAFVQESAVLKEGHFVASGGEFTLQTLNQCMGAYYTDLFGGSIGPTLIKNDSVFLVAGTDTLYTGINMGGNSTVCNAIYLQADTIQGNPNSLTVNARGFSIVSLDPNNNTWVYADALDSNLVNTMFLIEVIGGTDLVLVREGQLCTSHGLTTPAVYFLGDGPDTISNSPGSKFTDYVALTTSSDRIQLVSQRPDNTSGDGGGSGSSIFDCIALGNCSIEQLGDVSNLSNNTILFVDNSGQVVSLDTTGLFGGSTELADQVTILGDGSIGNEFRDFWNMPGALISSSGIGGFSNAVHGELLSGTGITRSLANSGVPEGKILSFTTDETTNATINYGLLKSIEMSPNETYGFWYFNGEWHVMYNNSSNSNVTTCNYIYLQADTIQGNPNGLTVHPRGFSVVSLNPNDNTWVYADASDSTLVNTMFLIEVINGTDLVLVREGQLCTNHGLTIPREYYLSDGADSIDLTPGTKFVDYVALTTSSDRIQLISQRPSGDTGAGSGAGGSASPFACSDLTGCDPRLLDWSWAGPDRLIFNSSTVGLIGLDTTGLGGGLGMNTWLATEWPNNDVIINGGANRLELRSTARIILGDENANNITIDYTWPFITNTIGIESQNNVQIGDYTGELSGTQITVSPAFQTIELFASEGGQGDVEIRAGSINIDSIYQIDVHWQDTIMSAKSGGAVDILPINDGNILLGTKGTQGTNHSIYKASPYGLPLIAPDQFKNYMPVANFGGINGGWFQVPETGREILSTDANGKFSITHSMNNTNVHCDCILEDQVGLSELGVFVIDSSIPADPNQCFFVYKRPSDNTAIASTSIVIKWMAIAGF